MDRVLDGTVSVLHAAALAAWLPPGSLCLEEADPRLGWTREELLLLIVANSKLKEPIDPFKKSDSLAMEVDDYAAYLARDRSELAQGGETI